MAKNHYQTLGVGRTASAAEIKSAYRKLVLEHHPDKSKKPESAKIFLAVAEAYEVLGDGDKRKHYDAVLDAELRRVSSQSASRAASEQAARARQAPPNAPTQPSPQAGAAGSGKVVTVAAEVTRLTLIFTRGQYGEAEKLARDILVRDPRQPIPYAVLGDLQRARGNVAEAIKMYAYAAQMDPRNHVYQQRYEELMNNTRLSTTGDSFVMPGNPSALLVGGVLLLCTLVYVIVAPERPMVPTLSLISTWTLGLCIMLFLSGVITGSSLSTSGQLDRFSSMSSTAVGKPAPMVALGTVAIVNFWAAVLLYGGLGLLQQSYNRAAGRFLGAVAAVTAIFALTAVFSRSGIELTQVLLWGGNLVYIGALCGWMVADSFRR